MGTERRRKKKKRLNWPAVLALVLLVSGTGLLVACKLEPGLLEVFQPMGEESSSESPSGEGSPAPAGEETPKNHLPTIRLEAETVWVKAGADFDPTANLTVSDAEDGALSYMQGSITPVPGTYTIISTVDLARPGAYVVTISAKDLAGAMSETGYSVRVLAEGEQPGSVLFEATCCQISRE